MTPKSLLRHPKCVSKLSDMAEGTTFKEVLDDEHLTTEPERVTRLILCSGKVYYDLLEFREEHKIKNAAIIRIEQLYPLNYEMHKEIVAKYPRAQKKWIWCQEEPRNMGAFYYIRPRLEELSNHKLRDRLLKGARTRRPSGAQDSGERQRQLEAEQAYQQEREALTRDDAPAALAASERAVTLHPEAAEYALGVAWLKYAAADKAAAPKLGEQAQRLASRLVGQQPHNALVNLTLGHFLRQERKLERAQRHLLLALDQESRWPTIEREMRALERQRRGESEGKRRDKR